MKGKRNRIVIDLDAPPAGAPRESSRRPRSRGRRVLAIIGVILFVIVVGVAAGVYFWWQHVKAQPSYTLALLVDAAHRNDNQEIDRILDADKISASFINDVRSRLTGSSIIDRLAPSQIDQVTNTITPQLKQTLRDALPEEIRRVTAPAKGKPFFVIALGVPYFVKINQNGATATVDMKFNSEQIQLTMQQQGTGTWRIESIKDDRLAGVIADAAKKGLSQGGPQLQDEIQRQLRDWKLPSPSP